jgi:hypothetical protein
MRRLIDLGASKGVKAVGPPVVSYEVVDDNWGFS